MLVAASIVVVAVVAVLLANSADSGSKHKAADAAEPKPPPDDHDADARARHGRRAEHGTAREGQAAGPRPLLMRATQSYVDDAILAPLEQGAVDNAYEAVVRPRREGAAASGTDRAVLTEARDRRRAPDR